MALVLYVQSERRPLPHIVQMGALLSSGRKMANRTAARPYTGENGALRKPRFSRRPFLAAAAAVSMSQPRNE